MCLGMLLLSRMTAATSYSVAVIDIVVTGFGMGITMPIYTIAVQNAVPHSVLGIATSSVAFFRSIGGAIGLAVLGSVMVSRFATDFVSRLSPAVKAAIPQAQLSSLSHNPQALVSEEAQEELRAMLEQQGPQGAALFEQVMNAMRHALSSALADVFLVGLIVAAIALGVHLFIREIPLRKQHTP